MATNAFSIRYEAQQDGSSSRRSPNPSWRDFRGLLRVLIVLEILWYSCSQDCMFAVSPTMENSGTPSISSSLPGFPSHRYHLRTLPMLSQMSALRWLVGVSISAHRLKEPSGILCAS